MRKLGQRGRIAAPPIALALLMAALGSTQASEARNLSPPANETGYPWELINRPVCWARPMPDEAVRCGGTPQRQGGRAFD